VFITGCFNLKLVISLYLISIVLEQNLVIKHSIFIAKATNSPSIKLQQNFQHVIIN
jgi:hypothetical protein